MTRMSVKLRRFPARVFNHHFFATYKVKGAVALYKTTAPLECKGRA